MELHSAQWTVWPGQLIYWVLPAHFLGLHLWASHIPGLPHSTPSAFLVTFSCLCPWPDEAEWMPWLRAHTGDRQAGREHQPQAKGRSGRRGAGVALLWLSILPLQENKCDSSMQIAMAVCKYEFWYCFYFPAGSATRFMASSRRSVWAVSVAVCGWKLTDHVSGFLQLRLLESQSEKKLTACSSSFLLLHMVT